MMGLAKQQRSAVSGPYVDCVQRRLRLPLAFVLPAADGSPSAYRVSLPVPLPASVLSGRTLFLAAPACPPWLNEERREPEVRDAPIALQSDPT